MLDKVKIKPFNFIVGRPDLNNHNRRSWLFSMRESFVWTVILSVGHFKTHHGALITFGFISTRKMPTKEMFGR